MAETVCKMLWFIACLAGSHAFRLVQNETDAGGWVISDVMLSESSTCPSGWSRVPANPGEQRPLNGDLNQAAGGKDIYLCKSDGYSPSPSSRAITGLYLSASGRCPSGFSWVEHASSLNGDINQDAGGKYIFLCKSEGTRSSSTVITRLYLSHNDCPRAFSKVEHESSLDGDLNQDAGGKNWAGVRKAWRIYLCQEEQRMHDDWKKVAPKVWVQGDKCLVEDSSRPMTEDGIASFFDNKYEGKLSHDGQECCSKWCAVCGGSKCAEAIEKIGGRTDKDRSEAMCCTGNIVSHTDYCGGFAAGGSWGGNQDAASRGIPPCIMPDFECKWGLKSYDGKECCPAECNVCGGSECNKKEEERNSWTDNMHIHNWADKCCTGRISHMCAVDGIAPCKLA